MRLVKGGSDPENIIPGDTDVSPEVYDTVIEKEYALEGMESIAVKLHRGRHHIPIRDSAHM